MYLSLTHKRIPGTDLAKHRNRKGDGDFSAEIQAWKIALTLQFSVTTHSIQYLLLVFNFKIPIIHYESTYIHFTSLHWLLRAQHLLRGGQHDAWTLELVYAHSPSSPILGLRPKNSYSYWNLSKVSTFNNQSTQKEDNTSKHKHYLLLLTLRTKATSVCARASFLGLKCAVEVLCIIAML